MAVTILVFQAFAIQSRPSGCATQQEPAGANVTCCLREITDTLETEHGVVNVERNKAKAVRAVRSSGSHPGRKRTCLGDAFLEHLPIPGFSVGGELSASSGS